MTDNPQRRHPAHHWCYWCGVAVVVPRSLRGRPSQVKGTYGVASAMPLTRHPGPASLHDPLRAALRAGHKPALHHTRHHHSHPTPNSTTTATPWIRRPTNHAQKQTETTTPTDQHPQPARHGPAPSGMTSVFEDLAICENAEHFIELVTVSI